MSDEFVDNGTDEEENFADLLESYSFNVKEHIQVGDKVRGKIISIGRDTIFVDTGTKIDGLVDKEELVDKNGELPYKEGDILELYAVSFNGSEIRLSKAISGIGGLAALEDAYENAIPVEGKIKGQVKGGFHVDIMQRRGFCPISQMDLKYVENPDEYVGETHQFLITRFEEDGGNIVLSRRALLEKEQANARRDFFKDIKVGVKVEGTVTKLMPYGVFVELFPGVEGMVHLSELSWSRLEKAEEVLETGDRVSVMIIGIEKGEKPDRQKISLSIKQVTGDPWGSVGDKFKEGDKVTGTVTRCLDFGVFVEIAPGIEGLVHVSEMSYAKRVLKPEDEVKPGELVSVVVKEIDPSRKRVSLSIKDAEGDPWLDVPEKYRVGQVVEGKIEKKEKFGYFVTLEPGITGLLPKSGFRRSYLTTSIEKLRQGDTLSVIIEEIKPNDRRITLGPGDSRDEDEWRKFSPGAKKPFGSLGEKIQKALDSRKGTPE